MVDVKSQHTQWAVGQGFFRTGRIETADVVIDYAYDCGSLGNVAQCRAEITEYANKHQLRRAFDVVYLSHFHLDHVNCVPDLIEHVGVKRFVIPLVPPAERLLVLAEALVDPIAPMDWDQDWYSRLIVDPADALRSLSEGIVVVEVEPGQQFIPPVTEPAPSESDVETGTSWTSPGPDGTATIDVVVPAGVSRPVWIWIPHVLADASSRQQAFVSALATELGMDSGDLDVRLGNPEFLHDVVLKRQTNLISAYKKASTNNLNLTSLCLYSGPTTRYGVGSSAQSWRSRHGGLDRLEIAAWSVRPGWLGTGDAPINTPARVQEITTRFRNVLGNVGVLALPHHGSRHNLHDDLLDAFSDPLPTCVVSAGAPNRYNHPHAETLEAVADRGFHLVRITGDARSRWTSSTTSAI